MSKKPSPHKPDRRGKQPTAFSLDPKKMAELMAIGSDARNGDKPTTPEPGYEKSSLLHKRLEEKLPFDSSDIKVLSEALGQMKSTIGLLASETVGELLESPNTGHVVIRKVKDHFKALSETAASEAEYETANALYYAAIAHALVYHQVKITRFSREDLTEYFDFLARQEWISSHLSSLFHNAIERCRDKK